MLDILYLINPIQHCKSFESQSSRSQIGFTTRVCINHLDLAGGHPLTLKHTTQSGPSEENPYLQVGPWKTRVPLRNRHFYLFTASRASAMTARKWKRCPPEAFFFSRTVAEEAIILRSSSPSPGGVYCFWGGSAGIYAHTIGVCR